MGTPEFHRFARINPTSVILKALVAQPKTPEGVATGWRTDAVPPRLGPYPKTRPAPAGGCWRSLTATAAGRRFVVHSEVQEGRENYKAMLAVQDGSEWRVLLRLEFHGSHPGLHIHDWCGIETPPVGGRSIDAPHRRPPAKTYHRRADVPSRAAFWKLALQCFRVIPSGSEQEDLL